MEDRDRRRLRNGPRLLLRSTQINVTSPSCGVATACLQWTSLPSPGSTATDVVSYTTARDTIAGYSKCPGAVFEGSGKLLDQHLASGLGLQGKEKHFTSRERNE